MHICSKLIVAALLAAPLAVLGLEGVAAQTANPEAAASIDPFCDYCKDYTDAATSAGTQASAYRPLAGYAKEAAKQAEAEKIRQQEETALRTREPKRTETE